jgi:hypothetical protein
MKRTLLATALALAPLLAQAQPWDGYRGPPPGYYGPPPVPPPYAYANPRGGYDGPPPGFGGYRPPPPPPRIVCRLDAWGREICFPVRRPW